MDLSYAIIFVIGLLSGLSISILLILITPLGDRIFKNLFHSISKKIKTEAEETLKDVEDLKTKEIGSAVDESKNFLPALK